eukprot:6329198-Prymnesium_polylepis.1
MHRSTVLRVGAVDGDRARLDDKAGGLVGKGEGELLVDDRRGEAVGKPDAPQVLRAGEPLGLVVAVVHRIERVQQQAGL